VPLKMSARSSPGIPGGFFDDYSFTPVSSPALSESNELLYQCWKFLLHSVDLADATGE
jgi:hypothetical protein